MQTQSRGARSDTQQKRKRFPWMIGVLVSSVLIVILVFVVVTLLVLSSQGVTQGITTLTILSIVAGFVVSVLSLLVSFLQWHHPKMPPASEEIVAAAVFQTPPLSTSEHPQSDVFLNDPRREHIEKKTALPSAGQRSHRFDWGEAPHMDQLYGRDQELATLKHWMMDDSCRLVAILGMGGMGKTSLAAALVDQVHEHYDVVFWRSLYNAPPFKRILQECIQFISDQQQAVLPEEEDRQISLLIESFRTCRCLLVLDNVESILQGGSQAGQYREGYEGYGRLLQRIGESKHQSCLLVTGREKPKEVALLEGEAAATRSYHLAGLPPAAGREILNDKGLEGTEHTWEALITAYSGNPLALKLVGQVIGEVFGGQITAFLTKGEVLFRDVRDVLEQQVVRLSTLEEEIVYWLAIQREAIGFDDLQEQIVHPVSKGELQEALRSLRRRQLIETSATSFTLHPVAMEYLTTRFVDRVSEEIRTERLLLFERHALLLAQAKDYIRESQRRLILLPLVQRLLTDFRKEALEQQCKRLLTTLRQQHNHHPSYVAGNILNLLIQVGCDLRGYDFSHLMVWQAYLRGVNLPEVNFAHADLATSVFTENFGGINCVTFSPKGDRLVAGTATGEIQFWHAESGKPMQTFRGHTNEVRSVAFNPDGKTLVSGSEDMTVRLWEVSSGKLLKTLEGHTNRVWSVAFSPDGKTLASGSRDRTVRLWEVSSGQLLNTLQDHGTVSSVAFSPDGKTLASGCADRTVRLWEVNSGKLLSVLQGHTEAVSSVAFSPDGRMIASSCFDQTLRLWDRSNSQCLKILQGYTDRVECVAFSPDGKTLASAYEDRTVRLWEVSNGYCFNTLQGHASWVWSVAFSPDGKTVASSGQEGIVRLWEVNTGVCLNTIQAHTGWVGSIAFSPDGKTLASGSRDRTVRLWEVSSGKLLKTLEGHTNRVWSIAFSPDGIMLASSSYDRTICLWEVSSGKLLTTLHGHIGEVRSIAFSPVGSMLASSSYDGTIKLWDMQTGACLHTLRSDRPYKRMNITQVKGLTEGQKATLRSLGAIENE